MRVRLQDIAEDLKLSKMTISRVLRGHADVSEQTKARVLQRIGELNYRPNASARGLRTGQAFRVGVLVPRLDDPHVASLLQGLIHTLQNAEYGVAVSTTEDDPEREESELDLHLSRHVDALFLIGTHGILSSYKQGVPVFTLGPSSADDHAHTVAFDESEIGRAAAAWLLARGAGRIAYLRGPRTLANDERFTGFLRAHRDGGVTARQALTREPRSPDGEYSAAYKATTELLRESTAPDAVMTNSDALALGARDAALAAGLTIPGQFQIVGCGNSAALCSLGMPLTSVAFSGEELGARAGRLALDVIASADASSAPRKVLLKPSVVARATTRKLPLSARRAKDK